MAEFGKDTQMIEKLAKAAHELFCEHLVADGYIYGPVTSETAKTHSSLVPFDALPDDEKEQNRNSVREIPAKLACIGYDLKPGSDGQKPIRFTKDEEEKLAEKEHDRWITQKQENGWSYGNTIDKSKKIHKNMVPWNRLTEKDKEKDRIMIRAIPKIVNKAGFIIEKQLC